jgi:hypothetical protein
MQKSVKLKGLLLCFTTFLLALPTGALPKYQSTKLPFPDLALFSELDHEMLKAVLALEVHQDSHDPNVYYYVPPFHIRQYSQGAASLMVHSEKLRYFAEAMRLMGDRKKISSITPLEFRERIKTAEARIQDSEEKLDEAIAVGNNTLIAHFEKRVVEKKKALEDLFSALAQEREFLIRDQDEQASLNLALTGYNVDVSQCRDSDAALVALKESASQASMSYGGFLSFNSYAGFTQQQIDALRAYKTKYMPHITVALLPLENLTFKPLTETQYDPELGSRSSKIFTRVQGAGDYLGTAIVLDTTVAGAVGMATHLPPFIVPVGISATFKQQSEPFDAELKCDFSSGYSVKGRADVKDGLVIYDNDITNTMKATDETDGGCTLKLNSGDRGSAEYKAFQELEKELNALHFHRAHLSYEEKTRYYQSVMTDIQQNRKSSDGASGWLAAGFTALGFFPGIFVSALSYAADFHWHTNVQDVAKISKFKYEKRFVIDDAHQSIKRDMPVNLCLVYNIATKAYDRCTEEELIKAKNMRGTMDEVQKSDECKNAKDPWECASNRDAAGLLPSRDSSIPQIRDNMLVSGL